MPFQIAIDGPVAAGKSTVARLTAAKLGFLYVDTGAMYRSATLLAQRNGIDLNDEQAVVQALLKADIKLHKPTETEQDGRLVTVLLDDVDVSWDIRKEEVAKGVSIVSAFKLVREELVKRQQQIAADSDVVMEGRDISYRVLPNAQVKIYLDAASDVRSQRWHAAMLKKGSTLTLEEAAEQLKKRDDLDMNRAVDPLKIVDDAWVLDTTFLTIDEVVDKIVYRVHELQKAA
jgi:cytidylate kinase